MQQATDSIYVLRVRRMGNGGRPKMIYSLTSVDSQTARHFATLKELINFIEQATICTPP